MLEWLEYVDECNLESLARAGKVILLPVYLGPQAARVVRRRRTQTPLVVITWKPRAPLLVLQLCGILEVFLD